MPKPVKKQEFTPSAQYEKVIFIGQNASNLKNRLAARGVKFDDSSVDTENCLVMIDGQYTLTAEDVAQTKKALDKGADVWIWGIVPEKVGAFNGLLPYPIEVTQRKATSLLIKSKAPIVAGLDHSDFYFCEIQKTPVMEYGLKGAFVDKGQLILAACDTDWTRWNKVEESVKTAAVLRSERQAKPAGAAMVQCQAGKGRILINTMTNFYNTDHGFKVLQTMLKNSGITLKKIEMDSASGVFDIDGNLKRTLICGAFGSDSAEAVYETDFLNGETSVKPKEHGSFGDRKWVIGKAVNEGTFDFNQMNLSGGNSNTAVYMSFWLWSPRPLDDLLIEPDMPKLDLVAGADDACKIWLNGNLIHEHFAIRPLNVGDIKCKNLPLKQGWNHFLVKVAQGGGQWAFGAKLNCSNYEFMAQLKAALENPDQ